MRDGWTFEHRSRLLSEAMREAVKTKSDELLVRIYFSDNFEPSLGMDGGIAELINVTPEQKAEERKRVEGLYAERKAIIERWAKEDAA